MLFYWDGLQDDVWCKKVMVYYIVNISLHISMDISLMLNITLKFLCIEPTVQWKSLQIIKKKKPACLKKAIFNFSSAPEFIVY